MMGGTAGQGGNLAQLSKVSKEKPPFLYNFNNFVFFLSKNHAISGHVMSNFPVMCR